MKSKSRKSEIDLSFQGGAQNYPPPPPMYAHGYGHGPYEVPIHYHHYQYQQQPTHVYAKGGVVAGGDRRSLYDVTNLR